MICKLSDIVNTANTGADAIKKAPILNEPTNLRCLRIGDVSQKRDFSMWGYTKTSKMDYERYKLHKGDSIIARTGNTIGVCTYIEDDIESVYNNGLIRLTAKKELARERFLFYLIRSTACQDYIQSIAYGTSTQPNMKIKDFLNFDIIVPTLEIQDKIIAIVDKIEKKIQVNTEINNNLEQQALAFFRHYFMDFAPYGGAVTSDWTEVSLDDVCIRITDGSHYSPADSPDSPYPMYSVKDMEAYGFNSSTCKHITEEEFCKMQKSDCVPLLDDILVAKDGSYLKEIFICSEEKDEAILSSIAIFRPDTSVIVPEILLYLLKQPSVRKDVGDNYVSGSALPRIVLKDFKKYRFMLPPMKEQQKIGPALHAIRMQIKANIDEMHRLSSVRDILLPKLMSGEIDVSDINF